MDESEAHRSSCLYERTGLQNEFVFFMCECTMCELFDYHCVRVVSLQMRQEVPSQGLAITH